MAAILRENQFPIKYVYAGDLRIHYQESGQGYPLICVHGTRPGATAWGDFHRNIDAFTKSRRTVWYDLPQYGKSDKPIIPGDRLTFTAGVIRSFMDAFDINSADFMGISMGGQIAIKFAIKFPNRVNKLILIGSSPFRDSVFLPMPKEAITLTQGYYKAEGPSLGKMRQLLECMVHNHSLITEESLQMRFEASNEPIVVEILTKSRPQAEEVFSELDSARNKTLIFWGQDDRASGLDAGLLLLRKLQDSRMYVIPQCGHWVHLDRSQEFNQMVLNFLAN